MNHNRSAHPARGRKGLKENWIREDIRKYEVCNIDHDAQKP